jgi:hypothetical protein
LQFLTNLLSSAYIELIILILLLIYFVLHRRDQRMRVSAVRMVRIAMFIVVFIYFMFIWASTVQPTLRSISTFGMFMINVVMLYYLVLSWLEGPYRDALLAIATNPEKHDTLHRIWRSGKRFYYARYTISSFFSGINPFTFLHDISRERVREDIQDQLRQYGLEQKLISFRMMTAYLKNQLMCDENLPSDFKEVMLQSVEDFSKHPWVEDQVNHFLQMSMERPEDLHFPEWMASFEECIKRTRK